jgi:hypothetical protein
LPFCQQVLIETKQLSWNTRSPERLLPNYLELTWLKQ